VAGALAKRADPINAILAELLAEQFTVYNYDRRARGDSTDTPPYAVEREVDDLAALVEEAGGSAYAYGTSSGGVLALEATRRLPSITKLAMYEPPFIVDDSRPPRPDDYVQLAQTLLEHDLVDELRLMVFPVVLGTGKPLFGHTSDKKTLRLVESRTVGEGIAILIYQPARDREASG
jgi:pimeloyl-ACP methyl ester carboxylesterase